MQEPLVIHGPQGCGKTRHAEALAKHFGCTKIVDDWNGRAPLEGATMALTTVRASRFSAYRQLPFADAARQAGIEQV